MAIIPKFWKVDKFVISGVLDSEIWNQLFLRYMIQKIFLWF